MNDGDKHAYSPPKCGSGDQSGGHLTSCSEAQWTRPHFVDDAVVARPEDELHSSAGRPTGQKFLSAKGKILCFRCLASDHLVLDC